MDGRDGATIRVKINFGLKPAQSKLLIVPRVIQVRELRRCIKQEKRKLETGESFSVIQGNSIKRIQHLSEQKSYPKILSLVRKL